MRQPEPLLPDGEGFAELEPLGAWALDASTLEAEPWLGKLTGLDVADVGLAEGCLLDVSVLLLAEGAEPLLAGVDVLAGVDEADSLAEVSVGADPSPDTKETLGPEGLLPSPMLPPLGTTGWMERSWATTATAVSAIRAETHGAGVWQSRGP